MNFFSKYFLYFLQLALLFIFSKAFSQDAHPTFKQYTVEDGLASSEVYQVKQDSKGYIWFATGNGVSRFNGYEFENFSMSNGLPDNTVFEIFEDSSEKIWFVPISCKLSYYYKGRIYLFKYNDALLALIKNALKTSFCVDKAGTVFIGISHDGMYEISTDGKITHHIDELTGLTITQPDSVNFICSSNTKKKLRSIKFDLNDKKNEINIPFDMNILPANSRVMRGKNKNIFISFFDKIIIVDENNKYTIEQFPSRINWLSEDNDGDLWVGTYLGGVYFVESYDFKNKKRYLSDISVDCILNDKEGGFWFATEGDAVYYSPSKYLLTYDKNAGLSDNRTNCLEANEQSVFVGLQNGYIHKITNEKEVVGYNCNTKNERSNGISSLFYDKNKNKLWVAANLHPGTIENELFRSNTLATKFNRMVIGVDGDYWFACANGIDKISNDKRLDVLFNNENKLRRINAILEIKKNEFYFGALDGLWKYNSITNQSDYFGGKDTLLKNRILDMAFGPDSLLIIATKGAGVLLYDKNRVYQINTSKGLCGDNVYRISVEGTVVWAGTNRGLNKINILSTRPFTYSIASITTVDGLASNEVNDVITVNDKVWVATNKGLSMFPPNLLLKSDAPLPIYINRIVINEKDTAVRDHYTLDFDRNSVKIGFIALGYKSAGKLKYRYKMLGLDTAWVYTTNREIQFTTLPANKYTFVLSVLNSNGEWTSNSAKVEFVINSPIWQKWWFFLLCILLFIFIVIMIFRYRIKKSKFEEEKNTALYKMFMNLKLKALRAQMNPHFTFNVMNSIQHFILKNDGESANRYLSKFSKLIRIILNNSEKNTVPIAEELKALELYLELEAMRFEKKFNFEIVVDESIDITRVEIPSMLIQPYAENCVKHGILPLPSNVEGRIRIEMKQKGKILECIIEDNGIGRSKAHLNRNNDQHRSFGTSITQERLSVINELYNSKLSERVIDLYDDDNNGIGTRVEIYIPIN